MVEILKEVLKRKRGRPANPTGVSNRNKITKASRLSRASSQLAVFENSPANALAGSAVVDAVFGIAVSTRIRWVEAGLLPAPIKIGRSLFWRVGAVRDALAKLGGQ
jgi:predicted DNA-binding transcriptional regulator AlpA